MDKKHTLPYSPECKLEAAQLVRKQGYSVTEAAKAIGVSKSAMRSWVNQSRGELQGKSPAGSPITQEQHKIREVRKENQTNRGRESHFKKGFGSLNVRLPKPFP